LYIEKSLGFPGARFYAERGPMHLDASVFEAVPRSDEKTLPTVEYEAPPTVENVPLSYQATSLRLPQAGEQSELNHLIATINLHVSFLPPTPALEISDVQTVHSEDYGHGLH
jgi:hypothetical protein